MMLTDNSQVDEGFSLAMLVLDGHLVSSLIRLLWILQSVLCLVSRCVNVVFRQTGALVEPFCICLWVSTEGNSHDKWLSSVCHKVLIQSLDLWHSYGRTSKITVNAFSTIFHIYFLYERGVSYCDLPASSSLALASLFFAIIL